MLLSALFKTENRLHQKEAFLCIKEKRVLLST